MCFNGNYASYAIDPDDWDKYIVFKPLVKKETTQNNLDINDEPLAEDDETIAIEERLKVGTR